MWGNRKPSATPRLQRTIHPAVYAAFKDIGSKPAGEPNRTPIDIVEVRMANGVIV